MSNTEEQKRSFIRLEKETTWSRQVADNKMKQQHVAAKSCIDSEEKRKKE
jgi:hypothetical protein